MKTFSSLIFLFLFSYNSYGQIPEFAPIGAKWWYRLEPEGPGFNTIYKVFEVEKDTVIDGIISIKIISSDFFSDGSSVNTGFEYFKKDSSEIAVYRNGSFHTFIKYNAMEGDTVTVLDESFNGFFEFSDETFNKFEYIIDSIGLELIDGNDLIVFYIHESADSDYWFGEYGPVQKIIKNIGAMHELSMLGFPTNIGFAGTIPKGLYCYETIDFKLSLNGGDCDLLETEVTYTQSNNSNFQISESNTSIIINLFSGSNYRVCLYNICGAIQYEDNSGKDVEINLSEFSTGIYILEIFDYSKNERYVNKYFIN